MKIEAEGKELVLKNTHGDTVIIPKTHRAQVLKHLQNSNYKAIDDIAESLPYMDDYAEDGTLVAGDPPVGKGITPLKLDSGLRRQAYSNTVAPVTDNTKLDETSVNINGIYDDAGYENLQKRYASSEMVKFGQKVDGVTIGCLGGCRRNSKTLYPALPDMADELDKSGIYKNHPLVKGKDGTMTGGIYTPNDLIDEIHRKSSSTAPDSWEIAQALEEAKLGKSLVKSNLTDPDRIAKLSKINPLDIPIGSIFSHGEAKGKYINLNSKDYTGKGDFTPSHSTMVTGFAEGVDEQGLPTTDILIDNLGKIERIGSSTKAIKSWDKFLEEGTAGGQLVGITTRNSTEKYTYKNMGGKNYPTQEKLDAHRLAVETKIKKDRQTELDADRVPENEILPEEHKTGELSKKVKEQNKAIQEEYKKKGEVVPKGKALLTTKHKEQEFPRQAAQ